MLIIQEFGKYISKYVINNINIKILIPTQLRLLVGLDLGKIKVNHTLYNL